MSTSDRLAQWVLKIRNQFAAGDPQAKSMDALFKKCASLAGLAGGNLNLLAALCGTDKYGAHNYTPAYEQLMKRFRHQPIRLLEIGVGGYQGELGGESLLMWAAYFRKGKLNAIDIHDKTSLSRGRIKVMQCSQTDRGRLTEIASAHGPFDFIIDDGSHINAHQIETFEILWPFLKDGGSYIIEDIQTSYWPAYGGGGVDSREYTRSCMSHFKNLVDSVNLPEFLAPVAVGSPLDATIGSLTFRHNLIILTKDKALVRSNAPLTDPKLQKMLMTRSTH